MLRVSMRLLLVNNAAHFGEYDRVGREHESLSRRAVSGDTVLLQ